MRRPTLSNIVLLAIAAGLGAFIALTPGKKPEVAVLDPLTKVDPRAISSIHLEPSAGGTIALLRADGTWELVAPMHIAANDFRVNALLGVLRAPVHTRIDASGQSLERFGLAEPQARILLDDKEILFGTTEPIHGRRYLLFDGGVALVDDAYFSHVSSSAANYVHPALLGRAPSLRSIALPDMRIYRQADKWRIDAGDKQASEDAIARLADAWQQAQGTAVRPYEQSLDWSGDVVIALADEELRFDLAHTEFELILGRADLGIQYHLTKRAGARLLGIEPTAEAP